MHSVCILWSQFRIAMVQLLSSSCEKVFGGIVLQPYLYVAFAALTFCILKDIGLTCFRACKKIYRSIYPVEELDLLQHLQPDLHNENIEVQRYLKEEKDKLVFEDWFEVFELAIALISTIVILIKFERGSSDWQSYTNLYASLIYSPSFSPLTSRLIKTQMSIKQASERKDKIRSLYVVGSPVRVACRDYNNGEPEAHPDIGAFYDEYMTVLNGIDFDRLYEGSITSIDASSRTIEVTLRGNKKIITHIPLSCVQMSPALYAELDSYVLRASEKMARMAFLFMFMSPCLTTHVIPGMISYLWVTILFIIAAVLAIALLVLPLELLEKLIRWTLKLFASCNRRPFEGRDEEVVATGYHPVVDCLADGLEHYSISVLLRLLIVLMLQSSFNYMALYYDSYGYLGTISKEYELRTQFDCYIDNSFSDAISVLSFFSFI